MSSNASQNTVLFLLSKGFNEIFHPRQIVIEHSFGDGYFCHAANWENISEDELHRLEMQLTDWLNDSVEIVLESLPKEKVRLDLEKIYSLSKLELIRQWKTDMIPLIRFGPHWDIQLGKVETDKSLLNNFKLLKYKNGFIIRFQNKNGNFQLFKDQPKLFSIIEEHEQWGTILKVSTIRELNELIRSGRIREMIWVAEGLHEKKISYISDHIAEEFPEKRIISIAGPSSSGKTTFAKRLGIQMRVNGFNTIQISMDDYFINREKLSLNEKGELDFESIDTVNIKLLCNRLNNLLNGNSIPKREYDFQTGKGHDTEEMISLGNRDFIMLEGIHGLNPALRQKLGGTMCQRIYVSAITQMNIDANHRISTSDNRLLRRMVRDHKYRGYSSLDTLTRWPMVRNGEDMNIFPFQEEADFMFNSSLVYELPVLAKYVIPLLKEIDKNSPFGPEAERLKTFLSFFELIDEELVRRISILREFIGGSEFNY